MEQKELLLSVKDLTVSFRVRGRTLTAVRSVSFDLHAGETLAVVGESGSGKSVLTKSICGMLDSNGYLAGGTAKLYDGGETVLSDLKKPKQWQHIRGSKIATVFQDPMTSLDPVVPIGKQITAVIRKHRRCSAAQAKREALEMMEKVGISQPQLRFHDYPFQYSGGMRQRIVIAIALSCRPKILICDEPTTALDVTIQAQILQLIKDLQKELGFAMVFITHDLGVVANVAHRVAVMYGGRIVESGTAEEIFYDPRHPYTWALLRSLPQLAQPGQMLYSIPGAPPSLYSDITGDPFARRNPYCLAIDKLRMPPAFSVSQTHYARTWLLDSRAPALPKPREIADLHEKLKEAYPWQNL